MSITGSLETFSLPELFQLIESGHKSGRLLIDPYCQLVPSETTETFYLWFERGYLIAVVDSLKKRYLISEIQNNGWINSELLIKLKSLSPQDQPFCNYLKRRSLLIANQIESLFQSQLNIVSQLFEMNSACFKFEEIDTNNKIPSDGANFPWEEMTGERKKATEVALKVMRNCSNWNRFLEQMPPGNSGLTKVVDEHDFQLLPLESHLWNTADGTVSLDKIARQMQVSLEQVQHTALAMIFAGLVEEVPIIQTNINIPTSPQLSTEPLLTAASNKGIKSPTKPQVSNSLLNNLVKFLRNNF